MLRKKRAVFSPLRIRNRLFATRQGIAGIAGHGVGLRALNDSFDSSAIRGLLRRGVYPREMKPATLEKMQDFVVNWISRRAEHSIAMEEQAKAIAEKRGIPETEAFRSVLERNRPFFEKRLREKAALEQLLFVFNHQRAAMARGRMVDTVAPTREVRNWAKQFYNPHDPFSGFVRLVEAAGRIPMIEAHPAIAEAYYALPTAEETLMADGILTIFSKGKPVWGCGMQCDVINAALNAWKIENYHVRTKTLFGYKHSVVLARPSKKSGLWLVADPFVNGDLFLSTFEKYRGSSVVSQVGARMGERIRALEERGDWQLGRCLREHMRNFGEFEAER